MPDEGSLPAASGERAALTGDEQLFLDRIVWLYHSQDMGFEPSVAVVQSALPSPRGKREASKPVRPPDPELAEEAAAAED